MPRQDISDSGRSAGIQIDLDGTCFSERNGFWTLGALRMLLQNALAHSRISGELPGEIHSGIRIPPASSPMGFGSDFLITGVTGGIPGASQEFKNIGHSPGPFAPISRGSLKMTMLIMIMITSVQWLLLRISYVETAFLAPGQTVQTVLQTATSIGKPCKPCELKGKV